MVLRGRVVKDVSLKISVKISRKTDLVRSQLKAGKFILKCYFTGYIREDNRRRWDHMVELPDLDLDLEFRI